MSFFLRNLVRQHAVPITKLYAPMVRPFSGKATGTDGPAATAAENSFNKDTLTKLVRTNKVVIFMKGNPEAPRCGFSNAVVQILRMHGVQYDAHDVLQNEVLRQSIKNFSDWPTIPQVFINGEFVGGCDILLQMHQSGDLIEELKKAGIESKLLKSAQPSTKKEAEVKKEQTE